MTETITHQWMCLNAAVTSLAFGQERNPSQETAIRRSDQHHIVGLIDRCQTEASTNAKFQKFPKRLPYFPLSALIEQLDETREHWPPTAASLYEWTDQIARKWSEYEKAYAAALSQYFSYAAQIGPTVVGRTGPHPAAPTTHIEPVYFLGAVTIGHNWSDIGPAPPYDVVTKVGSILLTKPGLLPIYYSVMVPRTQFQLLSSRRRGTHRGDVQPDMQDKIDEWYRSARITIIPRPPREADANALRLQFREVKKVREVITCLRQKYKVRRGRPVGK